MSSGGGGNQTSQTTSVPAFMQPYLEGYLQNASQVASQPYTPYGQQRVADLSPIQRQAIQGMGDLSMGTPSMHAADNMLSQTLQGQYMPNGQGGGANPGGTYGAGATGVGGNQYSGFGPQFSQVLNQGLGQIGEQFSQATNANLQRFQGSNRNSSAFQQSTARNEEALADSMSRYTSGMLNDQYNRSAQLEEANLGRQQNSNQFDANLGFQAHEGAAGRTLQGSMFNSSQGQQARDAERNRQMQAAGLSGGLAGAAGNNLMNAAQLGDLERRQQQSLLDSNYGDFREWRDYPEHQLGVFGNALGSVLGRGGQTTTSQGPGYDPVSQGIGMMMLGNNMGSWGGSK